MHDNLNFLCCSITFCPTSLHLHNDSDSLDLYLLLEPLSFSPDFQFPFFLPTLSWFLSPVPYYNFLRFSAVFPHPSPWFLCPHLLIYSLDFPLTVQLGKPWTLEIFQECLLCYNQPQQRSEHGTKPQNQTLISDLDWGLVFSPLIGFFLATPWHSRNISKCRCLKGWSCQAH